MGHNVLVASNGDFWKNYPRDIDLKRKPGKWGGISLLTKVSTLLSTWRDYDIVQIINPMFLELKAERIKYIYDYLRRNNLRMVLGAFGMDYYWVNTCVKEKPLRYSDFNIGEDLRTNADALKERADWTGTAKQQLNCHITETCNGIVAGLYEYWVCYQKHMPEKTTFIPYPIEVPESRIRPFDGTLRVFIGINETRNEYKGTDIMLAAAEKVAERHPGRLELNVARSVPFEEYQRLMDGCDAMLDQLYSYTPSMNSLLAMSKGIICIGGGEPENYEILDEKELRPIINVQPSQKSVEDALERLLADPSRIDQMKLDSIAYVRKHHDFISVARRYVDFYKSLLP